MKKALSLLLLAAVSVYGFQSDRPSGLLKKLEAGLIDKKTDPEALFFLAAGDTQAALKAVTPATDRLFPWLRDYLTGWAVASRSLVPKESRHFVMWTPPDQTFLADYGLPVLERARAVMKERFRYAPKKKVRVEIYSTLEDFSAASTLSMETLKRSGAIGICKFHRLMILTPRALPLGYRWLDALAHEYNHLLINEMSHAEAELWLHEGTARYFDTAWRSDPPDYLTPNQKTKLLEAREDGSLIEFKRMSPSLVYLKDQDEVSLAFAQVSHAIGMLIDRSGAKTFSRFLSEMKKYTFPAAFRKIYKQTPEEFETAWRNRLAGEKWKKVKGALSDDVHFEKISESEEIGASAEARVRLGDRMRMKNLYQAALIEYEKALEEEPDNALILLKTARTKIAIGKKESAIEDLRRAVRSNPNYITPYIELAGWVDSSESERLLREANAMNPFDPRIHAGLERIYEGRGERDKASLERTILDQVR